MFNLVVQVLSALLVLAIVQRTLRLDYFGGRFDRASDALDLAVALLWSVHPLQTETVIYVTQRTELLVKISLDLLGIREALRNGPEGGSKFPPFGKCAVRWLIFLEIRTISLLRL